MNVKCKDGSMNRLKAKRIAAVAGGAALLGLGIAFAGPVTFQNVPIINNAGAPVVQVVLGHGAQPSDGVAAASIAAAIGNLAYVSTPVTASVNATQAAKVLGATVPSASVTLSNQQVWLNESSSASFGTNSYGFTALIGSVFNKAIQLGSPINTKQQTGQQISQSTSYTYNSVSNDINPLPSPYVAYGAPSVSSVTASYNGGGMTYSTFSNSTNNVDDLLQVSSTQLPSLLNNYGVNGETEYLWLTGFPVFNQNTKTFNLASASGAYQVAFNNPITMKTSSNGINNADISLLGQNWTILSYLAPDGNATSGTVPSSTTVSGGKIQLAEALTPVQTLYVGKSFQFGNFTVQLADLGRANSQGKSPAILNIYYNGGNTPTNTTSIYAPNLTKFNVSGHMLFLKVKNVTNGYTIQYAKVQAYSNVYNITSSQVLNQTNDPGWTAELLWTNSSSTGHPNALQSIVLVNSTPETLTPGQSFSFVQSPSAYKLTFLGQTLGASSFDPVTVQSEHLGSVTYANKGTAAQLTGANAISNVTEPAEELVVTSSIPGAFTAGSAPQSSTLTYDLTPFQLNSTSMTASTANVVVRDSLSTAAGLVNANSLLTVTVNGYDGLTHLNPSFTINALTTSNVVVGNVPGGFTNVTSIKVSRAIPGLSVGVVQSSNVLNVLASLNFNSTPQILYAPASGKVYDQVTPGSTATYNQHNGQPTTPFTLATASSVTFGSGHSNEYFTYTMNELAVPSQVGEQDSVSFGLFNNTGGVTTEPLFILNGTVSGTKNNVTYTPTVGAAINANQSFVTERGSKIASIGPQQITFDIAKSVDQLQFVVAPSSASSSNAVSYSLQGPYGVGQATNIANVSIGKVTANVSVTPGAHFTVTGISNLTATPSVSSADTPVLLKNLSAGSPTNLVVLDSQANAGSTLVLVGSGYVNSLSAQLESALGISITPTSSPVLQAYAANTTRGARVLVAGYTANQTTAEANAFIQDLYSSAASSV